MTGIVERYLRAIVSHDWGVVDECIADDIVRAGPYVVTPEVLVFELAGDGRIARVEIYIQTPAG